MEDGFLNRNPAKLKKIVRAPTGRDIRAEKPEMVTWTADQLKAFLTWDRDVYHDENFALWLTLARTGMRRSEAVALQWRDIDFKASRISIRRAADVVVRGRTKVPKSGKRESSMPTTTSYLRRKITERSERPSHSISHAQTHTYSRTMQENSETLWQ